MKCSFTGEFLWVKSHNTVSIMLDKIYSSRMTTNNTFSPMKFCYNTSLPNQNHSKDLDASYIKYQKCPVEFKFRITCQGWWPSIGGKLKCVHKKHENYISFQICLERIKGISLQFKSAMSDIGSGFWSCHLACGLDLCKISLRNPTCHES